MRHAFETADESDFSSKASVLLFSIGAVSIEETPSLSSSLQSSIFSRKESVMPLPFPMRFIVTSLSQMHFIIIPPRIKNKRPRSPKTSGTKRIRGTTLIIAYAITHRTQASPTPVTGRPCGLTCFRFETACSGTRLPFDFGIGLHQPPTLFGAPSRANFRLRISL